MKAHSLSKTWAFARAAQEHPWRRHGEGLQQRLQSAVCDRRLGERAGGLRKHHSLHRRADERGIDVRNERPLTIVLSPSAKRQRRDGAIRATETPKPV